MCQAVQRLLAGRNLLENSSLAQAFSDLLNYVTSRVVTEELKPLILPLHVVTLWRNWFGGQKSPTYVSKQERMRRAVAEVIDQQVIDRFQEPRITSRSPQDDTNLRLGAPVRTTERASAVDPEAKRDEADPARSSPVAPLKNDVVEIYDAIGMLLGRGSQSRWVPAQLSQSVKHAMFDLLAYNYNDSFSHAHKQAVMKLIGSQPLERGSRRYSALRRILEWERIVMKTITASATKTENRTVTSVVHLSK